MDISGFFSEFMSAGQVLVDIEPHAIDCDGKIQPQVEQMTSQMNDSK